MNRRKQDNLCILLSSRTNHLPGKFLEPNSLWSCTFKHVQYIRSHNTVTKCAPETNVTMNHYGWSLHSRAYKPYTVSGLFKRPRTTHNVLIVNACFNPCGLLSTDINTFFKPRPSTDVEFNNHWKHLTLTRDTLTLFCTRDALDASGTFLQRLATSLPLRSGAVFP